MSLMKISLLVIASSSGTSEGVMDHHHEIHRISFFSDPLASQLKVDLNCLFHFLGCKFGSHVRLT